MDTNTKATTIAPAAYYHEVKCPECEDEVTLRTQSPHPPTLNDCYDHMDEDRLIACARKLEERNQTLAAEIGLKLYPEPRVLSARNGEVTIGNTRLNTLAFELHGLRNQDKYRTVPHP